MTDDPYGALHRRFDKLESNFEEVRAEQHEIAKGLGQVNHRIDLVEYQIDATHKREALIVQNITEKLAESSNLTKKLFDKFDQHDQLEIKERKERAQSEIAERDKANENSKKIMWWLAGTVVSVLSSIGWLMFAKVFQ